MKIQDGTGSGRSAAVTTSNRLTTSAVIQEQPHFIARQSGKAWSYTLKDVDPTGADDYFFYFKNTSTVSTYNINSVRLASTVAGQLELQAVSGTASGGTAVSPVSHQVNSTASPEATAESGVDITGLTSDGTLYLLTYEANKMVELNSHSRIIVPPGQAIALLWGEATGVLSGTISMYELPVDVIV